MPIIDPGAVNRGIAKWDALGRSLTDTATDIAVSRTRLPNAPMINADGPMPDYANEEPARPRAGLTAPQMLSDGTIDGMGGRPAPAASAGLARAQPDADYPTAFSNTTPPASPGASPRQQAVANAAGYTNFTNQMNQLRAAVSVPSPTGAATRRTAADRFNIDGGTAVSGATADPQADIDMQAWYGSRAAWDYFAANPQQFDVAKKDPRGFYEGLKTQSAMPEYPAAANIGKSGVTPPADQVAAIAHAVAMEESGNNPGKRSKTSTAAGAMQVLNGTARDPGYGVKPAQDGSIEERDRVGRDYLNVMVNRYDNLGLALIAYNQGPGIADKLASRKPLSGADADKVEAGRRYAANVMARLADHETNGVPAMAQAGLRPAVAGEEAALGVAPREQSAGAGTVSYAQAVQNATPAQGGLTPPVAASTLQPRSVPQDNSGNPTMAPATATYAPGATAQVAQSTVTPGVVKVADSPRMQSSVSNAEISKLMDQRAQLQRMADIYQRVGARERYSEAYQQVEQVDSQVRNLVTQKALDTFESSGDPRLLSAVLSQASGRQVVIQPRRDGRYNEVVDGQVTAQGLTREQIATQQRYRSSTQYAAGVRNAQIGATTKFAEENFKRLTALELEALKGRTQLTLEEIKGMGKVTSGRDGAPTTVQMRGGQVAVINREAQKGVDGVTRDVFTLAPLNTGGYSPNDYKVQ